MTDDRQTVSELIQERDGLRRRETDLLEHNGELLERERAATRRADNLLKAFVALSMALEQAIAEIVRLETGKRI